MTTHLAFLTYLLPTNDAARYGQKGQLFYDISQGMLSKRRLWSDISADMVTTCASSSEDD